VPLDPVVYFFVLGVAARALGSDLKLPAALYETLSIFLLLTIGLKGGVELARHPLPEFALQIMLVIALGILLPLIAYPVLRRLGRYSAADSGSIAAHYGSVSVVTFAVGLAYLGARDIHFESHMPLFVALLEAPAIVVGIVLGRAGAAAARSAWAPLLREVLFGKSIVLIGGGLAIGWAAGGAGLEDVSVFFFGLFRGVLCLFLLELGLIVGARLPQVRRAGAFLIGFGLLTPLVFSLIGAGFGLLMGLSAGGTALLATLAASASYIAAPAATRIALPQADPALSLTAALAVTFPFNITLGVPLYTSLASWLHG
jgi:uncharacterized protein